MRRRSFLRAGGVVGAAALLKPEVVLGRPLQRGPYFDLHPFVRDHPEAVFILSTGVADKTDAAAKGQVGNLLARSLFVPTETPGYRSNGSVAIKPNLTCLGGGFSEDRMGIVTDADFVAGLVQGMQEGLGLEGEQFYLREGNHLGDAYCPDNQALAWYGPLADRLGVHITDFDSGRRMAEARLADLEEGSEVVWRDVPDGVIFDRIGYVAPINAPDAFNINIAKFKAHGMGITLTSKNWQGTNVHPYVHYCESLERLTRGKPESFVADVRGDYMDAVTALHARHLEEGTPRWDRPGTNWNSGWGMEGWAQKTLDNLAASNMDLAMIEGIYGRDGNWMDGPHAGRSRDFMSNIVVFGRNPITVDIVGHWLAGHEPGNFGLFHAALTRGMTATLDPQAIPVYEWVEGGPQRRNLETFARTPLMTYYLRRDYGGQDEPHWHMVDEPFDYPRPTAVGAQTQAAPSSHLLGQNYPNPFNASTLIEYRLPRAASARVEIYNVSGQLVEVLADGWHGAGAHTVAWNGVQQATGTYFYRFMTEGFEQTGKMLLLR